MTIKYLAVFTLALVWGLGVAEAAPTVQVTAKGVTANTGETKYIYVTAGESISFDCSASDCDGATITGDFGFNMNPPTFSKSFTVTVPPSNGGVGMYSWKSGFPNTAAASISYIYNAVPTISVSCPAAYTTGASGKSVTANFGDTNGNLMKSWVRVYNNSDYAYPSHLVAEQYVGLSGATGSNTCALPSSLPAGTYYVTAQVTDTVGDAAAPKVWQWAYCSFTVNAANTAPVASVTVPASACAGANVSIGYRATDANSNLKQYRLILDSGNPAWTPVTGADSGAQAFSWNPAIAGSHTFKLEVEDTSGATHSASGTISVGSAPTISSFSASPASIISGNSSTLSWNVSGASSVSINQSIGAVSASGSRSVSPTATTTYTLTATSAAGCVSTSTATVTVTAPTPTGSVSLGSTSICSGGSTTLTWSSANAASVIVRNPGGTSIGTALSGSVSVSAAGTYNIYLNGSATSAASATLTVNSAPTISSFSASPASIVSGNSSTLSWNVSGASSLSINQGVGAVTGTTKSVSPTATTTYTLTATSAAGCVSTSTATVTVTTPTPTGSVSLGSTSICSGGSTTLTWSSSSATSVIVRNPSGTSIGTTLSGSVSVSAAGTYNIYLNGSATSAASTTLTVNSAPTISSFSASPASIVSGNSSTLSWSVSGASSISINQGVGAVTGTSKSVSPTATTTYTLTATSAAGCTSTSTATVTVTAATPTATLTLDSTSICSGTTNLRWTSSGATSVIVRSPSATSIGTSSSGLVSVSAIGTYNIYLNGSATSAASATLTAGSAPTISSFSASPVSIVSGNSSTLSWSVTGASSLSINQGVGTVTGTSISVSPTATTTYTLTATSAAGCTSTSTATVTVTSAPSTATGTLTLASPSVCLGTSVGLSWTSSGASGSLIREPGGAVLGGSINVFNGSLSVSTPGTYTLYLDGVSKATATLGSASAPVISSFSVPATSDGSTISISWNVSGATSVTLNGSAVSASGSIWENPSASTTYTLAASNASCSTSQSATVTVTLPTPVQARFHAGSTCSGTVLNWSFDARHYDGVHGAGASNSIKARIYGPNYTGSLVSPIVGDPLVVGNLPHTGSLTTTNIGSYKIVMTNNNVGIFTDITWDDMDGADSAWAGTAYQLRPLSELLQPTKGTLTANKTSGPAPLTVNFSMGFNNTVQGTGQLLVNGVPQNLSYGSDSFQTLSTFRDPVSSPRIASVTLTTPGTYTCVFRIASTCWPTVDSDPVTITVDSAIVPDGSITARSAPATGYESWFSPSDSATAPVKLSP